MRGRQSVRDEDRTNSSRLNHVADGESLDGLVLGRASRAVATADGLGVAAALLVAAVVLSLWRGHKLANVEKLAASSSDEAINMA